jgi:hypothetical protein
MILEDIDENAPDALAIENEKRKERAEINEFKEEMEICTASTQNLLHYFEMA